jgi:hypothetical protein
VPRDAARPSRKAGGQPVVLATGLEFAVSLVADDQFLYFEDGLRILRIAKQGGTPEVLFDSGNVFLGIATGLAIDDPHVYFEYSQRRGASRSTPSPASRERRRGAPELLAGA